MITPDEAIDRFEERFGHHPGHRAVHAKGTVCRGMFRATPSGTALCRAVHLQGRPVEALVRLSNGSGDPHEPDYEVQARGIAVTFVLPDGSRTDVVGQTFPRFGAPSVDSFFAFVRATRPGVGRPLRMARYFARYPTALRAAGKNAASLRRPSSYVACTFYAVHAYRWIDAAGTGRWVRYVLVPEARDRPLSARAARRRGADYLQEDLRARLARGPVRFTLRVQIAGSGDPVDDASAVWPKHRPTADAGVLELTEVWPDLDGDDERLFFDPARITDGIEAPDDPVLRFRSAAYRVSGARRRQG